MKRLGRSHRALFLVQCLILLPTALQAQTRSPTSEVNLTTLSVNFSTGVMADSLEREPELVKLSEVNQRSRGSSQLLGAAIGGVGGALLSLVMSNSAIGESGVHPLFVVGGAFVGFGIGSAFGDDDSKAKVEEEER